MNELFERIYHIQGNQPRDIGIKIGRRIGPRLEENISRYIQRRPAKEDSANFTKL